MSYAVDPKRPRKAQRIRLHPPPPFGIPSFEMAFFAALQPKSHRSNPPPAPSRRTKPFPTREEIDDFLSSDLEVSFASNVSLHSPPRDLSPLPRTHDYAEPMDISPLPPPKPTHSRPSYRDTGAKSLGRPRAFTSGPRLFGSDLSNSSGLSPSLSLAPPPAMKPSSGSSMHTKKPQRSALPAEWLNTVPSESAQLPQEPLSPIDDAMDVDTSYCVSQTNSVAFPTEALQPAHPAITSFNNLFFDAASPRRSLEASPGVKKRRSFSPEPLRRFESDDPCSPMPIDRSPSQPSKIETIPQSGFSSRPSKPMLGGLGAPSALFARRAPRSAVSAVVSSDFRMKSTAPPTLAVDTNRDDNDTKNHHDCSSPPARRAFSALTAPSNFLDSYSDDSSFDGPDMSSPAQAYSKRQQTKTLRRRDGTEDFKPLTLGGGTTIPPRDSPSSRFIGAGWPGFGDNEAHGKILPCHRVREDGLMRIKPQTLNDLLDGKYADRIADYYIIDCRFDYEYVGGHIAGAVNINTTAAVEELILGPSLMKPKPSVSGDANKKTILVFHCEFSAKRAPTFAKHLRAKDRAVNNHVYPKIHFPEVYVLEGGYSHYFKNFSGRCDPCGYVTMDDPTHAASRREDLDQFRKARFGRHKSYAYGEGPMTKSSSSQQPKRNTAPNIGHGQTAVFAAANAARSRRGTGALMTLPEDNTACGEADDTDTDIGDSPCPPPTRTMGLKSKNLSRGSLMRAETYHPARLGY